MLQQDQENLATTLAMSTHLLNTMHVKRDSEGTVFSWSMAAGAVIAGATTWGRRRSYDDWKTRKPLGH